MTLQFPGSLIHWMLVAFSFGTALFFGVGLTLYFERGPRPRWVLAVHYGSMILVALECCGMMLLPPRADAWVAAAIAMYALAVFIFLSAIEVAKRTRLQRSFVDHPLPDRLITDGPFKWVRHPFCSGYLLGALAGPVGIDHVAMILIVAPLVGAAAYAAFREERVWMSGPRAEEYREYRRQTGMFVPFIGRG